MVTVDRPASCDAPQIGHLRAVEKEFGVNLDYTDAGDWTTVGDVYEALRGQLPQSDPGEPDIWDRFRLAISCDTGIPCSELKPHTGLVAEDGHWVHVGSAWELAVPLIGLAGVAYLVVSNLF